MKQNCQKRSRYDYMFRLLRLVQWRKEKKRKYVCRSCRRRNADHVIVFHFIPEFLHSAKRQQQLIFFASKNSTSCCRPSIYDVRCPWSFHKVELYFLPSSYFSSLFVFSSVLLRFVPVLTIGVCSCCVTDEISNNGSIFD